MSSLSRLLVASLIVLISLSSSGCATRLYVSALTTGQVTVRLEAEADEPARTLRFSCGPLADDDVPTVNGLAARSLDAAAFRHVPHLAGAMTLVAVRVQEARGPVDLVLLETPGCELRALERRCGEWRERRARRLPTAGRAWQIAIGVALLPAVVLFDLVTLALFPVSGAVILAGMDDLIFRSGDRPAEEDDQSGHALPPPASP